MHSHCYLWIYFGTETQNHLFGLQEKFMMLSTDPETHIHCRALARPGAHFSCQVSQEVKQLERGREAGPAPLPAGGIISASLSSWMKKVTTTSLLLHTRKLLQVSGLKGFIPSFNRYIKNSRSWETSGGKSKEQMLGGHSRSGQGPGFTNMVTAHVQMLEWEYFGKGIREFLSQPSGYVFQGISKTIIQEKKNPYLFMTKVWK